MVFLEKRKPAPVTQRGFTSGNGGHGRLRRRCRRGRRRRYFRLCGLHRGGR
jgi:hypothetical protein